jgi:hypothetical protein
VYCSASALLLLCLTEPRPAGFGRRGTACGKLPRVALGCAVPGGCQDWLLRPFPPARAEAAAKTAVVEVDMAALEVRRAGEHFVKQRSLDVGRVQKVETRVSCRRPAGSAWHRRVATYLQCSMGNLGRRGSRVDASANGATHCCARAPAAHSSVVVFRILGSPPIGRGWPRRYYPSLGPGSTAGGSGGL